MTSKNTDLKITESLQREIEQACKKWSSELNLTRRDEEESIYHSVRADFRQRVKYEDRQILISDTEAEEIIRRIVKKWAYGEGLTY
jgi:hypothetical protein